MIRVTDILTAFSNLIGWHQSDTDDAVIAESLTQSTTGLYYQHAHPLLTLQNLKALSPNYQSINYQAYSAVKQYTKGEIVIYSNVLYKALKSCINVVPGTDVETWEVFSQFSSWLSEKTNAAIMSMISSFLNKKAIESNTKSILLNSLLYSNAYTQKKIINKTASTVGFELLPNPSKGTTVKLERVSLYFSETFKLTLNLYHSSSPDPVKVIEVDTVKDNLVWIDLQDVYLPSSKYAGGAWRLVYDETAIPVNATAYNSAYNFDAQSCAYCSPSEANITNIRKKYISVMPFKTNAHPNVHENIIYMSATSYGLNIELSVLCDLTDFIIQQKNSFSDLLMKQMAITMLREIAFNPSARVNRNALNSIGASKQEILYELDGDSTSMKKSGLMYQYDNTLKAMDLNTRGLDSLCLPCKSKGLKYKTVG